MSGTATDREVHIARVCHEANRALCLAVGDTSQLPWDAAPEWQRTSAISGVQAVLSGVGDPVAMHEKWCDYKLAQGWTFGAVKDEAAKTHPCLVPYDELPAFQQRKDHLFLAIVTALAVGAVWP